MLRSTRFELNSLSRLAEPSWAELYTQLKPCSHLLTQLASDNEDLQDCYSLAVVNRSCERGLTVVAAELQLGGLSLSCVQLILGILLVSFVTVITYVVSTLLHRLHVRTLL